MGRSLALAIAILASTALAADAATLKGTFALQGGTQKTLGYLQASALNGMTWRLDFWLTQRGGSAPIALYDVSMTKLMHAIVISDDFKTYLHEHPAALSDGHFVLDQRLPAPGIYHAYADARPTGFGLQVFRFDLTAGTAKPAAARDLSERRPTANVDGYAVTLSTLALRAGSETRIAVTITKDGKPAADIHPYLDALAHAIFIDAADLSYVHVHPVTTPSSMTGSMEAASTAVYSNDKAVVPPNMLLHVGIVEPGTYKLWFEFHGGTLLHVASFVLTAK